MKMHKFLFLLSFLAFSVTAYGQTPKDWTKRLLAVIELSDSHAAQELLNNKNAQRVVSRQIYNHAQEMLEARKQQLSIPIHYKLLKRLVRQLAWANAWSDKLVTKALPFAEPPKTETDKLIQDITVLEHPEWAESQVLLVSGICVTSYLTKRFSIATHELVEKINAIDQAEQIVSMLENRITAKN